MTTFGPFFEKTTESKWIYVEPSVRRSALLLYSDVLEIKTVNVKCRFYLAYFSLPRRGPNHFWDYFHTIIVFLSHFWPGTVYAGTVQVDFTASLGYFQVITTQKPVSLPFFPPWPCNFYPQWFPHRRAVLKERS